MSTVRINDKIKDEVTPILDDLGLSLSEAINVFLRQVIMTESIPFAIKKTKYSAEMIAAIKEADEMLKNPDKYKSFDNVDDLVEDLNKSE